MQREVKTMRKELKDAGEAGAERARLMRFEEFADFVGDRRRRIRSERGLEPSPHPDPEDPTGARAMAMATVRVMVACLPRRRRTADAAVDEAPPPMTTAEDVSLLSALEAFASPDGGYCGVNPALCAILHPALAKRRASRP